MGRIRAFVGKRLSGSREASGFRGEDLSFVGIRAFVEGFRAFVGRDSGRGGFRAFVARVSSFRGEGFGFWWLVFCRRVSGLGGEDFGLSWGAFVGASGFPGGFRVSWGFGFSWGFELLGRDSGFRIDFANLRLRAALKFEIESIL